MERSQSTLSEDRVTEIDITALTKALIRIRRIPLLGFAIRLFHLPSNIASLGLASCGLSMILAGYYGGSIIGWSYESAWAGTVLAFSMIVALPLFFAAWGVISLRCEVNRLAVGEFHDWIAAFFGPTTRIPMMLPASWMGRIIALAMLLISAVLGFIFPIAFVYGLYQTVVGIVQLYLTVFASSGLAGDSQAELIGRGSGQMIGAWLSVVVIFTLMDSAWRYFRRTTSVPSSGVLARDVRKPILFLRSFSDDEVKYKSKFFGGKRYFEELLAVDLWREGPVVAIGRPGEPLPRFGACREYHSDDTWQARVLELIGIAKGIVMLVGLTEALGWEIHQLRDRNALGRTIFLIPPLPKDSISDRLQRFTTQIPEIADYFGRRKEVFVGSAVGVVLKSDVEPIVIRSQVRTPLHYGVAVRVALIRLGI